MSTIGYTYGSQWHLLRFLGYHRDGFNQAVADVIAGVKAVKWLDLNYRKDDRSPDPGCYSVDQGKFIRPPNPRTLDKEFEAIKFLGPNELVRLQPHWRTYWPQTGTPPNWDSIARIDIQGTEHWLLVEAKSHLKELISFCGAGDAALPTILAAFTATMATMNINGNPQDWLGPYYQFCNRLAVLNFLLQHQIEAKLLFVYFLGDRFPERRREICPHDQQGWEDHLKAMEKHVGWQDNNPLAPHVHKLFLPVCP
jgi:hypothetical protein